MADIFISYSRADRDWVKLLANALETEGWSVWWDRELLAGDSVDDVIERELDNASCVIVVWSTSSILSRWVRDEAQEGLDRNVLLPITIDKVKPQLGFRGIQAENFIDWQGDSNAFSFITLLKSISRHATKSEKRDTHKERSPHAAPNIDGGKVHLKYMSEMGGQSLDTLLWLHHKCCYERHIKTKM